MASRGPERGAKGFLVPTRSEGSMQDAGYELPRILYFTMLVNKGK